MPTMAVLAAMGFAILGFYVPLTIYLQSVLGLSAIEAGLIVGAQPVAMTVTSGVASGLSQRVSGKYLLIPGLVVLAAGMGWVDWAMHADAGRWSFVPGLVVSRFGMGFVWTPAYSLATRDLSWVARLRASSTPSRSWGRDRQRRHRCRPPEPPRDRSARRGRQPLHGTPRRLSGPVRRGFQPRRQKWLRGGERPRQG